MSNNEFNINSTRKKFKFKTMRQLNIKTATKNSKTIKKVNKKSFEQIIEIIEIYVFMKNQNDKQHEKVILINNFSDESMLMFYRIIEKTQFMSHL